MEGEGPSTSAGWVSPHGFYPIDDEVNIPVLESLQSLIVGSISRGAQETRRLSFVMKESDVVELNKVRYVSLPEAWRVTLRRGSSTGSPTAGLWLDQSVLLTIKFCVGSELVDARVVIEANGMARIELALTSKALGLSPVAGSRQQQHIQRLVQIFRWYPMSSLVIDAGRNDGTIDLTMDEPGHGNTLRDDVFQAVKPVDWTRECEDPEGLQCSLYSYQRRALAWMLYREGDASFQDADSVKGRQYPSIRNVPIGIASNNDDNSGAHLMFDFHTSSFTKTPVMEKMTMGGILCDEMGLGKTVEMLALILASRMEESVHRKARGADDRLCAGTLVVVPPALLQQWLSEIHNHSPGLKVEVYNGIRHELERSEKKQRTATESDMADVDMAHMRRHVAKFFTGLSGKKLQGVTDDMVREAYFNTLRQTGKLPTEDPTELVMTEARRLAVADVVLTTFDVLKIEVDYDSQKNERRLRHPKRYLIPDCALLKCNFFRMVVDEAQMIGSFGAVAEMTGKIMSSRRWCVTGTPMISAHELSDIKSLLQFLGMYDASFASAWQRIIQPGFAARAPGAARQASWAAMKQALVTVMWRTDKQTVRGEITLPSRTLHFVPLRFFPGEAELYAQLVEKVAQAHTALEVATQSLKAMENAKKATKRSHEKKVDKLQEEERMSVLQLRLACIHPQLTSFWKREMASDLQIGSGGSASMMEVLKRLVDKEQGDLQEAERNLCSYVNTLAMRLCDQGDALRKREAKANASSNRNDTSGDNGALSPRTSSLQSPEKNPFGLSTSDEYYLKAQELLHLSKRVGNKGIRALDLTWEEAQKLPEPEASAASSWSAWQRLQINTNRQLIRILDALIEKGNKEENEAMLAERGKLEAGNLKRKFDFVETAQKELDTHAATLRRLTEKDASLRTQITDLIRKSHIRFDRWGTVKNPSEWWMSYETALEEARKLEAHQLAEQTSTTESMIGTVVTGHLAEVEKEIRIDLTPLDAYVARSKIEQAMASLESYDLEAVNWATENTLPVPMREVRYAMGRFAALLTPFKRDTILNQFSMILPVPRDVRVEHRLEDVKNSGPTQSLAEENSGGGMNVNVKEEESSTQVIDTTGVSVVLLEEGLGYSKPVDSSNAVILEAAAHHDEFIPATTFDGRVKGYAFYKSDLGVGYHVDARSSGASTQSVPIRYMMSQCATKLLHDLGQRVKSLTKMINSNPENEQLFHSLDMKSGSVAIENRLQLTSKLLDHVRVTRDRHVASGQVRLKELALQKSEEDVQDAANDYPVKTLRQLDKITAKMDEHKAKALDLQHKKAFMQNQLNNEVERTNIDVSEKKEAVEKDVEITKDVAVGVTTNADDGMAVDAVDDVDCPIPPTSHSSLSPIARLHYGPAKVEAAGGAKDFECPVCLGTAEEELCLFSTCGHAFCRECSDQLFRFTKSATCPICRTPCSHRNVLRVAASEPAQGDGHGRDAGKDHDPTAVEDPIISSIAMRSAWSIKIWAVVRRILALQQTAPSEKSLVFSQFSEALKVVSLALKAHEVPHVQLVGRSKDVGQAINAFREDDSVKAFLIAQKAGAQGLTLVRANHVFLLEPSVDPSIEQQAISRVHRIGQQRAVNIYRMAIKDTIEEKVLALQKRRQDLLAGDDKACDREGKDLENEDDVVDLLSCDDDHDEEDDNLLGQDDGNTATTLAKPAAGEAVTDLENAEMINALLSSPHGKAQGGVHRRR